jgi:hypothetical protein
MSPYWLSASFVNVSANLACPAGSYAANVFAAL